MNNDDNSISPKPLSSPGILSEYRTSSVSSAYQLNPIGAETDPGEGTTKNALDRVASPNLVFEFGT